MTIVSAGSAVACIDTARPAMMFVAWPVIEAFAMLRTGAKLRAGINFGDIRNQRR